MQDVTTDRNLYLGGSDISAILGISRFKTRWQLLQEKCDIIENDFEGNAFTNYGNIMEGKIRDWVNAVYDMNFKEDKKIKGFIRVHTDGTDRKNKAILEVKTTSLIHEKAEDYPYYLCQLLLEMDLYGYERGILSVYERPADFNETFDPFRLYNYDIVKSDWADFLATIWEAIDQFRLDWLRLAENPFLTEQDFMETDIVTVADKVLALETQLDAMKQTEADLKSAKAELKELMESHNVKSWSTPNGYKITLVPDGEPTEKEVFDEERFAAENPELYADFMHTIVKKGRAGYVRITPPKEVEE